MEVYFPICLQYLRIFVQSIRWNFLSSSNVVVFRYFLFCTKKAFRSTWTVLQQGIQLSVSWIIWQNLVGVIW